MALGSGDVPHLPRCRLGRITLRFLSFDHRYSVPHISTLRRSTLCRGPGNLVGSGFRVTTLRHSSANDHPSAGNHFYRVAHSICGGRSRPATLVDDPHNAFVGEFTWGLRNWTRSDRTLRNQLAAGSKVAFGATSKSHVAPHRKRRSLEPKWISNVYVSV